MPSFARRPLHRLSAPTIFSMTLLSFMGFGTPAPLPYKTTTPSTLPTPPPSSDSLQSIFTDTTIWIALFTSAAFFALAFHSFTAATPGRARFPRVDALVSALGLCMVVAGFRGGVAGALPVSDSHAAATMVRIRRSDPVELVATFWLVTSATAVMTAVILALIGGVHGRRRGLWFPRPDVVVSTLGLLMIVAGFGMDVAGAYPVASFGLATTASSTCTGVSLLCAAAARNATEVGRYLMPIPLTSVPPTATCGNVVPCSAAATLSDPSAWSVSGTTWILLATLLGAWVALPQVRRGWHADVLFRLATIVLLVTGFLCSAASAQLLLPTTEAPFASLLAPSTTTTAPSTSTPDPTSAAVLGTTTTTATPELGPAKRPGRLCLRMLMTMDGTATLIPTDRCLDPAAYGLSTASHRTGNPSGWLVLLVLAVLLGVLVGAVRGAGVYGLVPGSTLKLAETTDSPSFVNSRSPSEGVIRRRARGTTKTQAQPTAQKLAEVQQSWHRTAKPAPPSTITSAILEPGVVQPRATTNPGATRLAILLLLFIIAACLVPVAFASPVPTNSTVSGLLAVATDQVPDIEVPEPGYPTSAGGVARPSFWLVVLVGAVFVGSVAGAGRVYGVVPGSTAPATASDQVESQQTEGVSTTRSGSAAMATAYDGAFKRPHKRATPYKRLAFRSADVPTVAAALPPPLEAGFVETATTKSPGTLGPAVLVLVFVIAIGMVPAAFATPVTGASKIRRQDVTADQYCSEVSWARDLDRWLACTCEYLEVSASVSDADSSSDSVASVYSQTTAEAGALRQIQRSREF